MHHLSYLNLFLPFLDCLIDTDGIPRLQEIIGQKNHKPKMEITIYYLNFVRYIGTHYKMNAKLFACVILAAICFAQADFTPASWTGKWTFNDGTMNMCADANNVTLQVI